MAQRIDLLCQSSLLAFAYGAATATLAALGEFVSAAWCAMAYLFLGLCTALLDGYLERLSKQLADLEAEPG